MADTGDILVLEHFLPFRLTRLSETVSLKFASYYKHEYSMTRPEWRTLATLGQHHRLTSTQICNLSTMHKTKVSRAVHALGQRGWLVRERNDTDRRVEFLELNKHGRHHYAKLVALASQFEQDIRASFSQEDYAAILSAIEKLERLNCST